jgi:hypothetical protein
MAYYAMTSVLHNLGLAFKRCASAQSNRQSGVRPIGHFVPSDMAPGI